MVFARNGSIRARSPAARTVPRRTRLLVLATLVLAFAALYPYLDGTDACGEPGCPHFSQAHASVELPAGTLIASLATVAVAPSLAEHVGRRFASDRKPAQVYLSPEPDPPRL